MLCVAFFMEECPYTHRSRNTRALPTASAYYNQWWARKSVMKIAVHTESSQRTCSTFYLAAALWRKPSTYRDITMPLRSYSSKSWDPWTSSVKWSHGSQQLNQSQCTKMNVLPPTGTSPYMQTGHLVKANRIHVTIIDELNKKVAVIDMNCTAGIKRSERHWKDHKVSSTTIKAHKQIPWVQNHSMQYNHVCLWWLLKRGGTEYQRTGGRQEWLYFGTDAEGNPDKFTSNSYCKSI